MIAGIVPAAGASRRMGRPKLTLPIAGTPLIVRVVTALRDGGVDVVVVVTPPADVPGAMELIGAAADAGARLIVLPAETPDMRATVTVALNHLAAGPVPDSILLTPGDNPGLTASLVARVVAHGRDKPQHMIVPTFSGRRGHPIGIPWTIAKTIPDLPPGMGINALLVARAEEVAELPMDDPGVLSDLDTPSQYEDWKNRG